MEINQDNYYIPMSDEAFFDIKSTAFMLWFEFDDTHGYATEKIKKIVHLENVEDNGLFMVNMFDFIRQRELISRLTDETKKELFDRRLDPTYLVKVFNLNNHI